MTVLLVAPITPYIPAKQLLYQFPQACLFCNMSNACYNCHTFGERRGGTLNIDQHCLHNL